MVKTINETVYVPDYINKKIIEIYEVETIYEVYNIEFDLEVAHFYEKKLLHQLKYSKQAKEHFKHYTFSIDGKVVLREKYDISKKIYKQI